MNTGTRVSTVDGGFSRYVRALTASSIMTNGLAIKSLPPDSEDWARTSNFVRLVTKIAGVFLFAVV